MLHSWCDAFKKELVGADANIKGTILAKMQKPILTRWWTMGVAAAYIFDYYLQLLYAAQIVINTYGSDSSPYKIATTLFSMMKDPENFIDVILIRCLNKAYTHPYLDWLQSCDDLSGSLGFSSHHIAVRHYLKKYDLTNILALDTMKLYSKVVDKCGVLEVGERHRHLNKLQVFMREANDSLDKHFMRWIGPDLLPVGMMSDHPIAKVIAAAILGRNLRSFEMDVNVIDDMRMSGHVYMTSTVHKQQVDLRKLHLFICQQQEEGAIYWQEANVAAELIVQDNVDLWMFNYEGDNRPIRLHLHSTYLPLTSQTQFVESHVKDAKFVSQTDRSEELRTCMAIIRVDPGFPFRLTPMSFALRVTNSP